MTLHATYRQNTANWSIALKNGFNFPSAVFYVEYNKLKPVERSIGVVPSH